VFGCLYAVVWTIRLLVINPRGDLGASGLDLHWLRFGADIFGFVIYAVWSGLWVGYLLKSRRVKNTFTRPLKPFLARGDV
jgi:hypothetical protein